MPHAMHQVMMIECRQPDRLRDGLILALDAICDRTPGQVRPMQSSERDTSIICIFIKYDHRPISFILEGIYLSMNLVTEQQFRQSLHSILEWSSNANSLRCVTDRQVVRNV